MCVYIQIQMFMCARPEIGSCLYLHLWRYTRGLPGNRPSCWWKGQSHPTSAGCRRLALNQRIPSNLLCGLDLWGTSTRYDRYHSCTRALGTTYLLVIFVATHPSLDYTILICTQMGFLLSDDTVGWTWAMPSVCSVRNVRKQFLCGICTGDFPRSCQRCWAKTTPISVHKISLQIPWSNTQSLACWLYFTLGIHYSVTYMWSTAWKKIWGLEQNVSSCCPQLFDSLELELCHTALQSTNFRDPNPFSLQAL